MAGQDASAPQRRSLFPADDRVRILQQVIGKPTGTKVTVGGVDFDLVPLTIAQGREAARLMSKLSELISQVVNGKVKNDAELLRMIGEEVPNVEALTRMILSDSAFIDEAVDQVLFDDWFARLPLIETVLALLPKILETTGLGSVAKKAEAATETETSPTQSVTS